MYLNKLIKSGKSIFTPEDLAKIWLIDNRPYLKTVISRLAKRRELVRLARGFYAINNNYNPLELANKFRTPSYVSFETVLQSVGVVFQDYSGVVFSASNNTIEKKIAGQTFRYLKLKDELLANPAGLIENNNARLASPERAVCDRLYLSPKYYFDNPRPLDAKRLESLSKIYNRRVREEVKQLIARIKENYV